ncbi:OLC1v1019903C1 [Oldenlandia corymbosa var. corymbosa]|uniref:OLC1v1019903C1 n=1 Tax=Oldenlandia corymbosa var. corymbosa TaxID=529605 RepID=A0AAV1EF91_OLDCO|nr:OLC1v1019903C1 [Oldenlandia corymbosa var. corymbosa]
MCLARDRDGRNPLHLAAISGKLNILNLINHHIWLMQAAREKAAEEGGNILHLCVKYNQLVALKFLLQIFGTDLEFVSAKNDDGMTILHLAMHYNQNQARRQIIIYLIENTPEIINIKNADGKTILDIFLGMAKLKSYQFARLRKDERLLHELERSGGIAASLLKSQASTGNHMSISRVLNNLRETLEKSINAIMVLASLTATMAFQAMVSPPGGVWQDDLSEGPNPHRAGQSVFAQTEPKYYRQLLAYNTISFALSLSTILILLYSELAINSLYMLIVLSSSITCSVVSISVAYGLSLATIVPESVRWHLKADTAAVVVLLMVLSVVVIFNVPLMPQDVAFVRLRRSYSFRRDRQKLTEALLLADQSI